jgi:hypothetical protein
MAKPRFAMVVDRRLLRLNNHTLPLKFTST